MQHKSGLTSTAHCLNDFLFMNAPRFEQYARLLDTFRFICGSLGVPVAEAKIEGPSSNLIFLGIELDSVQQYPRLLADKLATLQLLLEKGLAAKKMALKELQVLVGHLNFACSMVAPGGPFCIG